MTISFLIMNGLLVICAYGSVIARSNQFRRYCGIITAILSVISLPLFLYLQDASGGADYGQVFSQRILPICGYSLAFLLGLMTCMRKRSTGEGEAD